jgi:hypothetical protein
MTPLTPSRRRLFTGVIAAVLSVGSAGLTAAGQFKWMVGGDKNVKYDTFKDSNGRFEIEYPAKDWKRLPVGSSLVAFARNDDATLSVDHVTLVDALTPAEIAGMPAVELSTVKDQQPKATDFKSDMLDSKAGRGVLIRYSRVGVGPETVVQYSIPVGRELFRINGIIADKQLAKYEPIVMYMIQSFKVPSASTAKD